MRFGQVGIESQRFLCRLARLAIALVERHVGVIRLEHADSGDGGIRLRVVWIQLERLLVVLEGFLSAFLASPLVEVPSLEVGVVSLAVLALPLGLSSQ